MSQAKTKIWKVNHSEPGRFWLDYILLPYGAFYEKTKRLLDAKPGDTLRFFNGPDRPIDKVMLIPCDSLCDYLCLMRYGIDWSKALERWTRYARLEGHAKGILSTEQCILVIFHAEDSD